MTPPIWKMRIVQLTAMFVTLALRTRPVPLLTVHNCHLALGCVSTTTE